MLSLEQYSSREQGGGILRAPTPTKTPSTPSNAFVQSWGPLASTADQIYVPGFSDPKQGTFSATQQAPAAAPSAPPAPAATKQTAAQQSSFTPTSQWNLWGAFLSGIMTPSQYYGQQKNQNALLMAGMRQ